MKEAPTCTGTYERFHWMGRVNGRKSRYLPHLRKMFSLDRTVPSINYLHGSTLVSFKGIPSI
jgi:hypothetical protein